MITKVAANHRNKTFGHYLEEDIEQEVWIIALEKLPDFVPNRGTQKDVKRSFEYWLNAVISNRLKNLYRDRFVVPNKYIKNMIDLLDVNDIKQHVFGNDNFIKLLVNSLTNLEHEVLESLLCGEIVSSYYKVRILRKVKDLWEAHGEV